MTESISEFDDYVSNKDMQVYINALNAFDIYDIDGIHLMTKQESQTELRGECIDELIKRGILRSLRN